MDCDKTGDVVSNQCARCKRTFYCGQRCQKSHWGNGGHKRFCRPPPTVASLATPAAIRQYLGVRLDDDPSGSEQDDPAPATAATAGK